MDQLADIYYKSVGRNSVLLLNIPPDSHGRLDDRDVTRLAEWRARLAADMPRDLAQDARRHPDGDTVTLNWPEPVSVQRISLGEDIRFGQQIEAGVVEARTSGGWQQVAAFGAVGQRRILTADSPVTTTELRVRVTQARSKVRFATVSVY